MARLTFDALVVLARISPHDVVTITEIAIKVFNGYDPDRPGQPTKGAMVRAQQAAKNLYALRRIRVTKVGREIHELQIIDATGGSLQAQSLMNLMVRGGDDRRKSERRADPDRDDNGRRKAERRMTPEGKPAPLRIMRTPPKKPAPPPSPFDIKNTFKL